jgi:hypothetical protein
VGRLKGLQDLRLLLKSIEIAVVSPGKLGLCHGLHALCMCVCGEGVILNGQARASFLFIYLFFVGQKSARPCCISQANC